MCPLRNWKCFCLNNNNNTNTVLDHNGDTITKNLYRNKLQLVQVVIPYTIAMKIPNTSCCFFDDMESTTVLIL